MKDAIKIDWIEANPQKTNETNLAYANRMNEDLK